MAQVPGQGQIDFSKMLSITCVFSAVCEKIDKLCGVALPMVSECIDSGDCERKCDSNILTLGWEGCLEDENAFVVDEQGLLPSMDDYKQMCAEKEGKEEEEEEADKEGKDEDMGGDDSKEKETKDSDYPSTSAKPSERGSAGKTTAFVGGLIFCFGGAALVVKKVLKRPRRQLGLGNFDDDTGFTMNVINKEKKYEMVGEL